MPGERKPQIAQAELLAKIKREEELKRVNQKFGPGNKSTDEKSSDDAVSGLEQFQDAIAEDEEDVIADDEDEDEDDDPNMVQVGWKISDEPVKHSFIADQSSSTEISEAVKQRTL